MYKPVVIFLCAVCVQVTVVLADDIDAYQHAAAGAQSFLHIVIDTGDASKDSPLCVYGSDCGPPLMTPQAHSHLEDMYSLGDKVTAPGLFRAVLAAVLDSPQLDALNVAVLISNHHDNIALPARAAGGGTILHGYGMLQRQRPTILAALKAIPVPVGLAAHSLQPKETYFEWMRYIRGGNVALGTNTSGNFGTAEPIPDYDTSTSSGGVYANPLTSTVVCPRLYSLLFTLGEQAHDEDLDVEISQELPLERGTSFERLLSYLHAPGTDVLPELDVSAPLSSTWIVTDRHRPDPLAEQLAIAGKTSLLYVDDPVALQARLSGALTAAITADSGAYGMSLSQNTVATRKVLDEVFVPMFMPVGQHGWHGNVKKLRLKRRENANDMETGGTSGFSQVVDARGDPAFESSGENRGKMRSDALTFWTDTATLPPGDGAHLPDDADGGIVARGGAGQKIDGYVNYSAGAGMTVEYFVGDTNTDTADGEYGPRQLYFESDIGFDLQPFDANAATVSALRPMLDPDSELDDQTLLTLIRWGRGQDTTEQAGAARAWMLDEVLHSRPAVISYGATAGYTESNPQVRILFGSGDGIFHILENTSPDGDESGREVFGFLPLEAMPNLRWRFEGLPSETARRYGVDGAPVVLRIDINGDGTLNHRAGDKAYVYFGMRRGGSSYYALDVSDPSALPRLMWKIEPTHGGPFAALGLTFSTPLVGKVNHAGQPVDVLIFAGGYNGGWNHEYTRRIGKDLDASDDAIGNALYIVNALTGELIWKATHGATGSGSNTHYTHAEMVDSIPSSVAALRTPEGIIERLYFGDTGGAVWRVDLPPNRDGARDHRKAHWFLVKLADLGADADEPGGSARDDRRFFHPPDIVRSFDEFGQFDGVLIQSGNRAEPDEIVVENALFYIKDRVIVSGSETLKAESNSDIPLHYADLPDQTRCIAGSEGSAGGAGSAACADRALALGWKIRYLQAGEKGLSAPLTDGGRVFASTYVPAQNPACPRQPGEGHMRVVRLANGTAAANLTRVYDLGPGIPDAVEAVGDMILLPGRGADLYDLDGDGDRDLVKLLPSDAAKLYPTYWREPGVDPL